MYYTFEQIGDQREWQAQTVYHQVGRRQADNELIGGGAQLACSHHQPDDGRVADAAGQENNRIGHTQHGRLRGIVAQRPRRRLLTGERRPFRTRSIAKLRRLCVVKQADPAAQICIAWRGHVKQIRWVWALQIYGPAFGCIVDELLMSCASWFNSISHNTHSTHFNVNTRSYFKS